MCVGFLCFLRKLTYKTIFKIEIIIITDNYMFTDVYLDYIN